MSRDIRTLLFCKTMPEERNQKNHNSGNPVLDSHPKIYKELSVKLSAEREGKSFFAFGGYSALCVYKTMDDPDKTGWLSRINEDRHRITQNTFANVVCHQMHLVSSNPDVKKFWNNDPYPFFFTTLVYGVTGKKNDKSSSVDMSSGCSSVYEKRINQYIQSEHPAGSGDDIQYAVYNGINISDIVILWKARDIGKVMKLISGIEFQGIARKTLTTISFPMDSNGEIEKYVYDTLKNSSSDCGLCVTVRGSIRNINEFTKFQQAITKSDPDGGQSVLMGAVTTLNPGKNDFSISRRIEHTGLASLLQYYYAETEAISKACWEIYTDLLVEERIWTLLNSASAPPPTDILSDIYNDYKKVYVEKKLYKYLWGNPLLEQLNSHYYIDRNAMLHGPSYMIYHTLHIANAYFNGEVQDYQTEDKLNQLLVASQPRLIAFIENLDQLTEQITRNDDAVLNNRSNTHTTHFSLPESALEFYHAFLRRIVAFLTVYDYNAKRVPDDFEYDFLIIPKYISRFRFSPIFITHHDLQSSETSNMIWPTKQAYLLEFPMEAVFSPKELFIPMVHECCHCFGDVLRNREKRRDHMIYFVATTIVTYLGLGQKNHTDLVKMLAAVIFNNMPDGKKIYLDQVADQLVLATYQICDLKTLDELFDTSGGTAYYLYTNKNLSSWNKMKESFFQYGMGEHLLVEQNTIVGPSIVAACKYYFKECYADAMTIALLGLQPDEYLNLVKEELHALHTDTAGEPEDVANDAIASLSQRFAIVLAACKDTVFNQDTDPCESACQSLNSEYRQAFVSTLRDTYTALVDPDKTVQKGKNRIPPAALKQVVEYIRECLRILERNESDLELTQGKKYNIDALRKDFNELIREDNMFGLRFYQLIYEHHEDVRLYKNKQKK